MPFAYVITTHRDPEAVYRLVARIRADSPSARIIVRHDAGHVLLDPTRLAGLGAAHHPSTRPITWGDWSIVTSYLEELRRLEHEDFSHVAFVSGQDFVVGDLTAWEQRVLARDADLVTEVRSTSFTPRWWRGRSDGEIHAVKVMYAYRRLPVPKALDRVAGPALFHAASFLSPVLDARVLPRGRGIFLGLRRPLRGLQPWTGSQWMALSRRAALAVLETVEARPRLVRRYRFALNPEESFFHTILGNDLGMRVIDEPVSFARWPHEGSPHPVVLTAGDIPAAVASGAPFARKFEDPAVIDELERFGRATPPR